jgi:hypothetical protein
MADVIYRVNYDDATTPKRSRQSKDFTSLEEAQTFLRDRGFRYAKSFMGVPIYYVYELSSNGYEEYPTLDAEIETIRD